MIFRHGFHSDISGFLSLQEKNLLSNLNDDQEKKGFVTTPFSPEQLEDLISENGLFIAEDAGSVVGYAVAASWDFLSQWPIFPYMVSRFPGIIFQDKALDAAHSFQYGPVCIDEQYRGSGSFQKLFEAMRIAMNSSYPIGLTFINKVNAVSFAAHTRKLNLTVVDEFEFNERSFHMLAFDTNRSVL